MKSFDKTASYIGTILANIYMFMSVFLIVLLTSAVLVAFMSGFEFKEYWFLLAIVLALTLLTYVRYNILFHTKEGKRILLYMTLL